MHFQSTSAISPSLPMCDAKEARGKFFWVFRFLRLYIKACNQQFDLRHLSDRSGLMATKLTWAGLTLQRLGISIKVTGAPVMQEAGLFVGNHISYMDIPVLASITPACFVAKSEVQYFPIVRHAARFGETVFVKRGSKDSRRAVAQQVAEEVKTLGKQVAIFPSGTSSLTEHKPWRWGAFQIAHANGFKMQPFRLRYTPLRQVAYIDRDVFFIHMWQMLKLKEIYVEVEFAEPFYVTSPEKDAEKWHRWTQEFLR